MTKVKDMLKIPYIGPAYFVGDDRVERLAKEAVGGEEWGTRETDALMSAIRDLRAERDALAKARERLEHIAEYWNLGENDRAMSDALYHMIEEARDGIRDIDAALAAQERKP